MKRVCALICIVMVLFTAVSCEDKTEQKDVVTLSWWVPMLQHVEKTSSNFAENEMYKELMERTGVNIEFIHPKGGETFDVLLMSNDLPDIIEYSFFSFKGGPQAALDENFIISLDSFLDEYSPNYAKVLKENPSWDKEVTTENGSHYTYAWIRGDESLLYWKGLQVRSDLLKQAGLSVPETINEWDVALRKFKEMGIKYPLTYRWSFGVTDPFASAYNTFSGYYEVDGVVKFSPFEEGYKNYIELLHSWYKDGILDPDAFTQSDELIESKLMSGQVGAYMGTLGGNMGNCLPELKKKGAGIVAAPTPVMKKGDKVFQSQRDSFYQSSTSVSISRDCENIEAAARLLDYGYSEEGHLLYNFGIEGVSYEMVDGYPRYLPEITNSPDGLSMQHAMSKYMASAYGGPFIQDKREYEQYLRYPEQKYAVELWSKETEDHKLPQNIIISPELESKDSQIRRYCSNMLTKFITGEIPMTEYDSFLKNLKLLGVEEIISSKQKSLDKYNE